MMDLKSNQTAANTLYNLVRSGLDIRSSVKRLSTLPSQKKYRSEWLGIYDDMAAGQPLSSFLNRIWPEELSEAVKVGESSGSLQEVFLQISETLKTRIDLAKQQKALYYPFGIIIGSFFVCIGILGFVVPSISKLNSVEPDGLTLLALWLNEFLTIYGLHCVVAIIGFIAFLTVWLQKNENRTLVIDALVALPIFKYPFTLLYWGIWAQYLSLMLKSGVGILEALIPSSRSMPNHVRAGIDLLHSDLIDRRITDLPNGVDPEKLEASDPRQTWPFFVSNAFLIGSQTGDLAHEMENASEVLFDEGREALTDAVKVLNLLAMMIAAIFVGVAMMAFFLPMAKGIQEGLSG